MERRGNYFMPNNGQIGFSPLHMLGLSAMHPKSMQQGFVDVSVNTHTLDNNFSLFKCKDRGTEIVNMKNDLINTFGCGLPVGNSFSKLIGGFIGSKCLIGTSTGRENNFWGRVLQQYNNIIGANNNLYIEMSAVNSRENTCEYIKAGVVDAALLFSQNFDLFSTNNLISQEQIMGATKNVSPQESPTSSVELHVQTGITTEPKQSYAEVTKSRVAIKSSCSATSDRPSTCNKRLRSVRRYPMKLGKKEECVSIPLNNNWRYSAHCDVSVKHMDNTNYSREYRRKHCGLSHDNQQRAVAAANSIKGTGTPHTSEDQKMTHSRTKPVQHSASRPNRKLSGKRKLNSNLLNDIKEDCLDVDDELMACEKRDLVNHKFSHSPSKKWTAPADQKPPSSYCANWRCRPYSLCDPCKTKDSHGSDVTDCYRPHTQWKTVTFDTKEKGNDKQSNVPETPLIPLTQEDTESSAKSASSSDSSLIERERSVSAMCPVLRTRMSSECSVDSEDSFVIVFDASGDDSYEEASSETDSVCSDGESSDDDETSSINSQCVTYKERSDLREDCGLDYGFEEEDDKEEEDDDEEEEKEEEEEEEEEELDFDDDDDDDDAEIESVSYISETELKEANSRWERAYEDTQSAEKEPEKVHFAESPELTTVHKIIAWDFAYRMARIGPWKTMACDRARFHRRIEYMNRILGPVLQDQHRRKMWQKFHKETLNVP